MTTAIVTLPDGRRARVTFDSQEQLDATIADLIGPTRSPMQQAGRALGIGTRNVIEGAAAYNPLSMAADAVGGIYNTITGRNGSTPGTSYPVRDTVGRGLDAIGLPRAETESEQRTSRVAELGAGAMSGVGFGRAATALPAAVASRFNPSPLPAGHAAIPSMAPAQGVGSVFSANPLQQVAASTAAPATGEGLRSAGFSEPVATGAEIGMSMLTPSDAAMRNVARAKDIPGMVRDTALATVPRSGGGRAVGGVRDVLTTRGRDNVVGRILRSGANDPVNAERNLGNVPAYVPGSKPTMGQASRDVGLLRLEGIAENTIDLPDITTNPGAFAAARSAANTARNKLFGTLKPVDEAFESMRMGINKRFEPELKAVMESRSPVKTAPLLTEIDDILTTPGLGQRQELVDNLNYARQRIEALGPQADPLDLQAVRQDISELIEGKLKGAATRDGKAVGGGVKGLSRAKMRGVVDGLDDAIETGAKGYKAQWLTPYAKARQELDQRKVVGDALRKASSTQNNSDDLPILSAAGMDRWMQANASKMGKLTEAQRTVLINIRADLKRAARGNSANVQGSGSSTAKNIVGGASVASIIGRAMGGAPQRSPVPLGDKWKWLFGYTDRQINDLLVEAMLEPTLGRKLLAAANKEAIDEAGKALEDMAIKRATATTTINTQVDK